MLYTESVSFSWFYSNQAHITCLLVTGCRTLAITSYLIAMLCPPARSDDAIKTASSRGTVRIWLIKLQDFVEFLSEVDNVFVVSPQQLFYQCPHSRCKFTTNQLVVERLSCIILSGQNPIAETPNNFNSYLGKCDNLLFVVRRDKPDQEPPF